MYGSLGVYWTAGGGGFPFAPIDQAHRSGSVLEGSRAEVVAPIMAVLGLLGAVIALAMARGIGSRRSAVAMIAVGWIAAASLTLFVPDYTMIALVAFGPLLLVFAFTGVPGGQDGIGDILYWHRTNLIILFVGGLLWAAATLAYQRRVRARCQHCGRLGATGRGPSRQTLLRWGRWAVAVACLAPLPYEITRVAWYLGYPLGISPAFLKMMQDTPGMLEVGLGCAVASTVGGIFTHGLVGRWGEIYPRWIWFKAGQPVPLALAVVPASIVSIVLVPAGLMMLWAVDVRHGWALQVPSIFWLLWSAGLGGATYAYYLRRRSACQLCGQGGQRELSR
ncbi:NYN domain-containing protein [Micromonospora sp. NPDC093277]|uniref:NYN domain-containing protein n=1 Tax=Micromonospora sp. NPDC093277 TaxID=3364291 RepID=UPI00381540CE